MSLPSYLLATWLLASSFLILPGTIAGQVPSSDSTAHGVSDTAPVSTDSGARSAARQADTVLQGPSRDTTSRGDSTRVTSDTAPPTGKSSTTTSDTRVIPSEPIDSIVSAACSGAGGATEVARDLLVIVFAPGTGAADRAAVAKRAGGKLVGTVLSGEPGAYYLRVPSRGNEYQLRAAADKLIQMEAVRQVGSQACPPASTGGTAKPQPS